MLNFNNADDHRLLFQHLPFGLVVHAPDATMLFANEEAARLLGVSQEQIIGKIATRQETHPEWSFVTENEDPFASEDYLVHRVRVTQQPASSLVVGIDRHVMRDRVWVLSSAYPQFSEQQDLQYIVVAFFDITDRKLATQAFNNSEKRFQTLVESAPEPIFIQTSGGCFAYVNKAAMKLFNAPCLEELLGQPVLNFIHPDCHVQISEYTRHLIEQPQSQSELDIVCLTSTGEQRQVSWLAVPFKHRHKDGALVFARDITQRKQAEQALRESEERLQLVMTASNDGLWDWNLGTNLAFLNERYYNMMGYESGEVVPDFEFFKQLVHPEDLPAVLAHKNTHLQGLTAESVFEHRMIMKDGTVKWMLSKGKVVERDTTGAPLRMLGTLSDINERKLAEAALQASEARFASTFHATPAAIGISRLRDGQFIDVNNAFIELYGYSREELIGHTSDELALWQASDREAIIDEVTKNRQLQNFSIQGRRKNGEILDLLASLQLIELNNEPCLLGILVDITNQKRIEAELLFNNVQLKTQLEASIDGILVVDEHARIASYNQRFIDMWNIPQAIIDSKNDRLVLEHGMRQLADPEAYLQRVLYLYEHRQETGHDELLLVDGRCFERYSASMLGKDDYYHGRIWYFRDITARHQAELERQNLLMQLQQAQKMESIGRLAGGIAHDFSNILQVITNFTEAALDKAGSAEPLRGYLEKIYAATGRSAKIIRQLLAFARQEAISPQVLDLNKHVEGTLHFLQHLLRKDINLSWHPGQDVWPIFIDSTQLDQIIVNLCINAQDAVPDGGKINLATYSIAAADPDEALGFVNFNANFSVLSIQDNGCGMAPEILNKIFEPFFTTKRVDQGTGLGLATVHGIVKQNHGCIKVDSQLGVGTTFTVYLPKHTTDLAQTSIADSPVPLGKGETVLLVEDDTAILRMIELILNDHNYRVIATDSPAKALQLVKAHPAPIHLLLTDIVMPELNGYTLADQIQAINPSIKCLFMSGYVGNTTPRDKPNKGDSFLQKPYLSRDLLIKAREVLDESPCPSR